MEYNIGQPESDFLAGGAGGSMQRTFEAMSAKEIAISLTRVDHDFFCRIEVAGNLYVLIHWPQSQVFKHDLSPNHTMLDKLISLHIRSYIEELQYVYIVLYIRFI